MLRILTAVACLALTAPLAQAAEAGKVIFVAGSASMAERPASEGAAVQEGDLLATGADGFLYVKTIDNGLFILRPNTRARIVSYHVDAKNPANTRIKLDLISGVARSKSGNAVKQVRQNFRFNTPVAAIGVRGTDFTVFTDQDTSRVSVLSGGVVVSGFAGACRPEGNGPCEGAASRELTAAQRGQLLQIKRGAAAPQLMSGSVVSAEQSAQPVDAPFGANGPGGTAATPVELGVDVKKAESLSKASPPGNGNAPPQVPVPQPSPPIAGAPSPPVVMPPPVLPTPERSIVWGRWQRLLNKLPNIDLVAEQGRSELLAVKGNYALFRTPGNEYVVPEKGSVGFAMYDSDAFVYTDYGTNRVVSTAMLTNGKLNVDFGTRTFATSVDLYSRTEKFSLSAEGAIGKDGQMFGDAANSRIGYMNVQGLLSNEAGGTAAYVFDARLDQHRTVNGGTFWRVH